MKIILSILFICSFLYAKSQTFLDNHFNSNFYKNQWVGFYLYDPENKKEIYSFNGNKYFTPASNIKIFTLYSALKILPDSIPALAYKVQKDTIYIKGTGDPTLLENYFKEKKVINFLKKKKENIALYLENFNDTKFAPGWTWDDYSWYYSPERSSFPLYGNVINILDNQVTPSYFTHNVFNKKNEFQRDWNKNVFYTNKKSNLKIPFITSDTLTRKLLELAINKTISLVNYFPKESNLLYSVPSDSLFKRMMLNSDNFLSEQIMLLCSFHISENLNISSSIDYITDNYLKELPQKNKWIDGSGLSRYNFTTPENCVFILNKLYEEWPLDRILNFFSKKHLPVDTPYIFSKTGSMSQVYNLSGYLKTKSGKILIFSYMNNNFINPTSEIKNEMKKALDYIRDNF